MSKEAGTAERHTAARAHPDPPAAGPGPRGSWARLYAIVIAALALDILLLWWLTERYR